jgi:hypothetical protein
VPALVDCNALDGYKTKEAGGRMEGKKSQLILDAICTMQLSMMSYVKSNVTIAEGYLRRSIVVQVHR